MSLSEDAIKFNKEHPNIPRELNPHAISDSRKKAQMRLAHNLHYKQSGYIQIAWGDGQWFNCVPQILEDAALNSGVAKTSMRTKVDFCLGDGFKYEPYNLLSVSDEQDPQANGYAPILNCLREVLNYAVFYDGAFALRIYRNPQTGNICLIKPCNLGNLRIGITNKNDTRVFRYNQFTNRLMYSVGWDEFLPEYNPDLSMQDITAMIDLQVKNHGRYCGEIYYHYIEEPGAPYYPIPAAFRSLDLVKGVSASEKAFNKKAMQSWIGNFVLKIPKLSNETGNNGQPSEKEIFMAGIKAQSTGDADNTIILLENDGSGTGPDVSMLNNTAAPAQMVDVIANGAMEVCKLYQVDPVLAGYALPGQLGNVQQIVNAQKMLNSHCKGIIQPILDAINPMLLDMGISLPQPLEIKESNQFQYVDAHVAPWLFGAMTKSQALGVYDLDLDSSISDGPMPAAPPPVRAIPNQ